jgi:hypothetical protein
MLWGDPSVRCWQIRALRARRVAACEDWVADRAPSCARVVGVGPLAQKLGSFQGKKISSWIIRRLAPKRAPALCGCKKHGIDTYGDHTATCTAHSGATKAHDWAVGVLGPLFRSAGHTVRTQHQVTASAGHRRGDVEIREYVRDAAGSRSLVFDLSITHDRFGSSTHVQQNRTSATRRI